jgi:hypothetical protein
VRLGAQVLISGRGSILVNRRRHADDKGILVLYVDFILYIVNCYEIVLNVPIVR